MLSERINSAVQLMETVDQVKNKEAAKKSTAQTNNTFFAAFETFTRCMESYLLVKKSIPWFLIDISTDKVIVQLCSDIKKVFEGKKVFHIDSINKTVAKINDNLANQWQIFFGLANQKKLDDLTILMQVSEKKGELRDMYKNILGFKSWPVSQQALENYQEAISLSEQHLRETKFDEEIEEFLKKVRDKNATLSDITPSILEWLEAEGLKGKISLSIRA